MGQRSTSQTRATPTYRVFVSHATADKRLAVILCNKLDDVGVISFRDDKDIDGGDEIRARIIEEVRRSDEFVVIVTPRSTKRQWIWFELGLAMMRRNLRIVPIIAGATADQIPAPIQWRKAWKWSDLDRYLETVKGRAKGKS
jgi:hypothetical protein